MQTKKVLGVAAALAALGAGTGVALAGRSTPAPNGDVTGSRLDDGKDLLPRAKISEQAAIKAAQGAASGALNEVDLKNYRGHLVFNVDVGTHDVKVDSSTGDVLASDSDD
jgi:uncharacterized membrane protein YkoI